jgi:F0F1-type ATP synthase membrane subunit a
MPYVPYLLVGGVVVWFICVYLLGAKRIFRNKALIAKIQKRTGSFKKFFFLKAIFVALFVVGGVVNIYGLVPYNLSLRSHGTIVFVLFFRIMICLWVSRFGMGLYRFMSEFTPLGRPLVIAGFLRIIEIVSTIIRPFTLSLRLRINISTGHIFLAVLGRGRVAMLTL